MGSMTNFEIELHFRGEKQVLAYLFSANVRLQMATVTANLGHVPFFNLKVYRRK